MAFFLAEQWLYRGEPAKAEALLPDDSPHSLRFIQGRNDEAIREFEAALKAVRRTSRKRSVHIPGLAGVCFVLALRRSGDLSHHELAKKQLLIATKAAETVYEYFGHYPRTVYSLDGDEALLEAIGHPLLFWADDPGHPVELIRDEPVLEVLHYKGKLELWLQPFPHS